MFLEFIFQKILESIIWLLNTWVEWKWNLNLGRLNVAFFLDQIVKNLNNGG